MGPLPPPRPVQNPEAPSAPGATGDPLAPTPPRAVASWPEGALDLAEPLLRSLAISDRDWHAVKTQPSRRAAEQLAAALVQLLSGDDPRRREGSEARQRAIDLVESSLGWLRGSLSDPGCPHRGGGGQH